MRAETSVGIYVKLAFCLSIVTEISILVKVPNIKFHENPFSGSRVVVDRKIF
jgi:hypothetical protein